MNELSIQKAGINLAVFKDNKTVSEEDRAKVREYAKLMKVQADMLKEIEKVSKLISFIDARWCKDYIWINQQGGVTPIFDIDDDYLKNIYNWALRNEKKLSKGVLKEYISRFGIPETLPDEDSKYKSNTKKYYDDEYDDF